jgi:hypothetical protein
MIGHTVHSHQESTAMTANTDLSCSSPADLLALAKRLDRAAEELSDRPSNDYALAASADNKKIATAALKFIEGIGDYEEDWDEFAADIDDADDEIEFFDHWLMAYMAHRCKQLAAGKNGAGLSKAEQDVISGLLAHAAERSS